MVMKAAMRAARYARVSTVDKNQNPETQLRILGERAAARGRTVTGETPAGRASRPQLSSTSTQAAPWGGSCSRSWAPSPSSSAN